MIVSDHGFGAVAVRNGVSGGHGTAPGTVDGIYLIAGGPIRDGSCPREISLYSVAPTLLYLLGLPLPSIMTAEVPTSLMDRRFLELHPVVRSDAPPQPRRTGPRPSTLPGEEERIERLRALGYLE